MEKEKIEELEETKKEEKKKDEFPVIMVLLVLIFMIGIGLGFAACKLIAEGPAPRSTADVEEKEKKDTKKEKLELTDSVKTKLERFVKAGTFDMMNTGTSIMPDFKDGITIISKKTKLKMAFVNVLYLDKKVENNKTLSTDEINALEGYKPAAIEPVDIIKKSDFDSEYKALFGEDAEYVLDDLKDLGCPAPQAMNKEKGNLYLIHACGGATLTAYSTEITSYDSDTDYYYVHQVSKYDTEGKVEENKLVWKFDKDLKFVSTEKE